ncbi:MAG: type I methionyl aminopeptidase [Candidatus Saccharimonadales bacterium]
MMTKVKTSDEIQAMRESGAMLATVLTKLSHDIRAGMSTKDLAEIAKKELRSLGGQPTCLGYYGFPDVICISVNDEVVHGIPRPSHIINDGDIVSLDFGVTYKGMITDSARTVIVGKASPEAERLLLATERSLRAGIEVVRDGVKVGDIAAAVQSVLDAGKYGIVRDLVGHGVGHHFHEDPNIPNYGRKGTGMKLSAGMTIAIEPMATLGGYKISTDRDQWTIRTVDGSMAAHFEDTVLITQNGAEVLTKLS